MSRSAEEIIRAPWSLTIEELGPLPSLIKPNCRVTYYVKIEAYLPPIKDTMDVVAASYAGAIGAFWRWFDPVLRYNGPVMAVTIEGVERI